MVATLSEHDLQLLGLVARYRLMTAKILASTRLAATNRSKSAQANLERLVKLGFLQFGNLAPGMAEPETYYHLSAKGAKQLGHDVEFAQPPRLDARIEHFAIASFCCGSEGRQLFTKDEFTERFRSLWYPGQPVRYYIEPAKEGPAKLAFIKVDKDGAGRWDRLIDKCAQFLRQRTIAESAAPAHVAQVKMFRKLVEEGKFQFTVLTALDDKKRAIEIELERRRAARIAAPPISVHVVPRLWEIMFPDLALS